MDCLIAIIKYFFQREGINSYLDDIESLFFDNNSFVNFFKIIYNVEEIPGVKKDPYSNHFQFTNIVKVLNFVIEQSPEIYDLCKSVDSKEERIEFIKLVLAKKCFTMTDDKVVSISNLIINSKHPPYKRFTDIMNYNFFPILLNKLTDDDINIDTKSGDNSFNNVIKSFQKALAPLVINEDSFKIENKNIYSIQAQIIFDVFSDKIKKIQKSLKPEIKNILLINFNPNIQITDKAINEDMQYYEEINFSEPLINNDENDSQIWHPEETREDEALLLTIGFIAEQLKICSADDCKSFEITLFNNFIPLFVMRYLNIQKIDHLCEIKQHKTNKLSYQEIQNIKIVIDYLKKKEKKFELLLFDFNSPHLFVHSAKTFFIHFLNTYFVRHTKMEMMERYDHFLGSLDWYAKPKLFTQRRYDTFSGLLSIVNIFYEQESDKKSEFAPCIYFSDLKNMFKQTKVPMICGIDIMDEFYHDSEYPDSIYYQQTDKELPNSIIYQLQFILNKIDSLPGLSVAEILKNARYKLSRVKVMKLDLIKSIMIPKAQFIQLKRKVKKIDQKELDEMKKNQKSSSSKELKVQNFEQRQKSSDRLEKVIKITESDNKYDQTNDMSKIRQINSEAMLFWNPINPNYKVEEDILYSTNNQKQSTTEFIKQLKLQEQKIQKDMNFKKDKTLRKKTLNPHEKSDSSINLALTARSSSYSFESRLYKLFYYDDLKLKWIFDSEAFSLFGDDKKINVEGSKTPVIFYFNSNESDLVKINKNFILGDFPILNQDQIFVYALCEKQLSKLYIIPDFIDQDKMLIKPIFLLLHVPKEMQKLPFISTAIQQIYIFLNDICDLTICLYNESHIKDQIEILNEIISMSNHVHNNNNNQKEKNIIFVKNNPNAEYIYNYDAKVHQLSVVEMSEKQKINFYFANFDKYESYKPFIDQLTEMTMKSSTTFSDITRYFNDFYAPHLSGMYIHIYNSDSWKEEIKKVIEKRFLALKSHDSNFDKNPDFVLMILQEEFSSFAPIRDTEFHNECIYSYSLMRKTFTKQNDRLIKKELQKSADQNTAVLMKFLKDLSYFTKDQIKSMINTHVTFLKKEYFNIIKAISDEKFCHYIYQDNYDVLQDQIESDKKKINYFANPILDYFRKEMDVVNVTAEKSSKRGTNYTLKEVEIIRDTTISVESVDELEKEIDQDF